LNRFLVLITPHSHFAFFTPLHYQTVAQLDDKTTNYKQIKF